MFRPIRCFRLLPVVLFAFYFSGIQDFFREGDELMSGGVIRAGHAQLLCIPRPIVKLRLS